MHYDWKNVSMNISSNIFSSFQLLNFQARRKWGGRGARAPPPNNFQRLLRKFTVIFVNRVKKIRSWSLVSFTLFDVWKEMNFCVVNFGVL